MKVRAVILFGLILALSTSLNAQTTWVSPALDLAIIAALLSSYHDIPISQDLCFASEIGLSGEIRPVAKIDLRVQEAEKLGFKKIAISKFSKLGAPPKKIKLLSLTKVESFIDFLF